MGQTSRETWAKRVARWKASGLRAKEFGAKFGIKPKSLEWWKWRLGADAKRQRRPRKSARCTATAISPLTFVEMATVSRARSATLAHSGAGFPLEARKPEAPGGGECASNQGHAAFGISRALFPRKEQTEFVLRPRFPTRRA